MINVKKYEDLGRFNLSWLNAHYHFSFANYHDPARMGLGVLRVINDDTVKAGGGFDMHPHKDMEIITYVRKGAITHRDSLGNEGRTAAGDVQVMSAGTGIVHAEHNHEREDTNLYQIWIQPHTLGVKPRWEQRQFPKKPGAGLALLVSGLPEHSGLDILRIHANGAIYGGVLEQGATLQHSIAKSAYLLVSEGMIELNGTLLSKGDGAEIRGERTITLHAPKQSEVVLIDLPE